MREILFRGFNPCDGSDTDTLCWFDMEEGGAYSEVIGTVFDEEKSHEN